MNNPKVSVVVPIYKVEPFCRNVLIAFKFKRLKTLKSSLLMMVALTVVER